MSRPSALEAMADFASSAEPLPGDAHAAAVATLANCAALGVGAASHPAVSATWAGLQFDGAAGSTPVLGRRETTRTDASALLMGIAMHVDDFDDTYLPTIVHPGPPVVAAALAAGAATGAAGCDVVRAVAVGAEITIRLAVAWGAPHIMCGWHTTGTAGHGGAAVAAALLRGHDRDGILAALRSGLDRAAGLTAALGTMTKSFHPGKAAADAVQVAWLAPGPGRPAAEARGSRWVGAADSLGQEWLLCQNSFKPYACGVVSHPVIDLAILLRSRLSGRSLERADLVVHPLVLEAMGVLDPADALQSKFSASHCFAVGMLDGAAGPAQFTADRARAADADAVRRRVRLQPTTSMPPDAARARVELTDGSVLDLHVDHATGSADRPLTIEQLRAKSVLVTEPVLGQRRAEHFADVALSVHEQRDLRQLFDAGRPAPTDHVKDDRA